MISTIFESSTLITKVCPIIINKYTLGKDVDTNNVLLQIKFQNVSTKNIIAVEFSIDSFDILNSKVDSIESSIYQDMVVNPRYSYGDNLFITLKDINTRTIRIACKKVAFEDHSIWENKDGISFETAPKYKSLEDNLDSTLIDQLKNYELRKVGINTKYLLERVEFGRLERCTCGQFNFDNKGKCLLCGCTKEFWNEVTNKDFLQKNLNERLEEERKKREEAERQRIEREKEAERQRIEREKEAERQRIEREKEEEKKRIEKEKEEERKKLELEEKREQELKEKEEKKAARDKRMKKLKVVIPIVLVCIVAGICISVFYIVPKSHYDKAKEYMKERKYYKASEEYNKAGNLASDKEIQEAENFKKVEEYENSINSHIEECVKNSNILKVFLFPNVGKQKFYVGVNQDARKTIEDTLKKYNSEKIDEEGYNYALAKYLFYCNLNPSAAWEKIKLIKNTKQFKDFETISNNVHDGVIWNSIRTQLQSNQYDKAKASLEMLKIKNDTYNSVKKYLDDQVLGKYKKKSKSKYVYISCDTESKSGVDVEVADNMKKPSGIVDKVKNAGMSCVSSPYNFKVSSTWESKKDYGYENQVCYWQKNGSIKIANKKMTVKIKTKKYYFGGKHKTSKENYTLSK